MKGDPDKRIEELTREKLEGKSYSEMRKDLSASGMADEELSQLIRQVDERVLKANIEQGDRNRAQQWYRSGFILAAVGLLLSIGYNVGVMLTTLPSLAVYSPFVAGILLMFYGRMLQRKRPKPPEKGPGPIRMKRPYK
jgi:hypothetical protein